MIFRPVVDRTAKIVDPVLLAGINVSVSVFCWANHLYTIGLGMIHSCDSVVKPFRKIKCIELSGSDSEHRIVL